MFKPKFDQVAETEKEIVKKLESRRERLINHFPLWSALAATFGVVMIFYGFEKLIDKVQLFVENPWILLITGLAILIATGTTYKKL